MGFEVALPSFFHCWRCAESDRTEFGASRCRCNPTSWMHGNALAQSSPQDNQTSLQDVIRLWGCCLPAEIEIYKNLQNLHFIEIQSLTYKSILLLYTKSGRLDLDHTLELCQREILGLYSTLLRLDLEYCIQLRGPQHRKNKDLLGQVQRRPPKI